MSGKSIAITALIAVVIAAAAAFGGYTMGVQAGAQRAQDIRARFLADRGLNGGGQGTGAPFAAGQANGNGARQFNPDNFAAGQVKSVNGNTIELSTATSVVKVQVGSNTQIQKMDQGSASDVQPGERITVQGTRGSDGTMTAQAIQIGGGLRGRNGAAPGGTGTPSAQQ